MISTYPRLFFLARSLRSPYASIKSIHTEPKLCKNCKYFLPNEKFQLTDPLRLQLARCEENPVVVEDKFYLVTGAPKHMVTDYQFCSTARTFTSMCGPEGLKYVAKNKEQDIY